MDKWEKQRQEAEAALRAMHDEHDAQEAEELAKRGYQPEPPPMTPEEELQWQLKKARLRVSTYTHMMNNEPLPKKVDWARRKLESERAEVARLEAELAALQAPRREPAPAPSPPVQGDVNETALGAIPLMAEPLPFRSESPSTPELSVEQYASLCVERTLYPGQDAAVAQRYRVPTQEALHSLDAQWRQRLQSDAEIHRRFQQAYAQYEAWLRSRS